MNRRTFISNSSMILAGAPLMRPSFMAKSDVELVILHTNDLHSRIDPFPLQNGKFGGMGGAAKRASLIQSIRNQHKNVLLLDSGDILQGTPFFNFYNGALEFRLMEEMKYDATTIGNHDFDAGMEHLAHNLKQVSFPMLCSNYSVNNTPLNGLLQPYKTFRYEGIKVGVFGLGIKLKGLVPSKLYGDTQHEDPLQMANATATILKMEHYCDIVICLSHLGYEYRNVNKVSDVVLAKQSNDIDIILGGHTHTFMEQPHLEQNLKKNPVLINQVGWAGIVLGQIKINLTHDFKKKYITPKSIYVE